MKALSVRQPWASLIASGQKTLEIRTRRILHRGPLLICSSRNISSMQRHLCTDPAPPLGMALCLVDVIDCRRMVTGDEEAARIAFRPFEWAWVLSNPRAVNPFSVHGNVGLYNVDDSLIILTTETVLGK